MNPSVDHPLSSGPAQRFPKVVNLSSAALILLLICLLSAVNLAYHQLMQSEVRMVRFIINGEGVTLGKNNQSDLSGDLEARISGLEAEIDQRLQPWLEEALAEVETSFVNAGESYLDWHFSLTGSYSRLGVAVMGDLEPWMEDQLDRRLIQESGLEESLSALRGEYEERLIAAEQDWLIETLAVLHQRYAPLAVMDDEIRSSSVASLDLDQLMVDVGRDQLALPRWRAPQASVSAGFVGLAIIPRLIASPAMQTSRAMLRRFLARVSVHAARSAATGASAAAVTAPSGPWALLMGGGAAGTSLAIAAGSEFAAHNIQEAQQRPEIEAELGSTWNELEQEVRDRLLADKQARVEALLEHLEHRAAQAVQESELPKTYRILG